MKSKIALLMLGVFVVCVVSASAHSGGYDKKDGKFSFDNKFFKKAHCILRNNDELGLTDEQYAKIKQLKLTTKKDLIMKEAEIEIVAIDIKALLWDDKIDVGEADKLLDKKYFLKKEKAKMLIRAYAALKDTLTQEQKDKLAEIRKEQCKKSKKHF